MTKVKVRVVKNADQSAGDAQDRVINQTNGVIEGNIESGAENRGESLNGSIDDIGNHRGNKGRYQDFAFHALQIQNFRRQDAAAERRFKDGGNTGAHTGGHGDAAVFNGKVGYLSDERTETGAHLGGRAFRAGAAAGADGNRRGDKFNVGDAPADVPVLVVESVDGGIGAVAFGFRRQFINDKSRQQTAQRGNDGNRPAVGNGGDNILTFAQRLRRFEAG